MLSKCNCLLNSVKRCRDLLVDKLEVGDANGETGASNPHSLEDTNVAKLFHHHGVLEGHGLLVRIRLDTTDEPGTFPVR